MNGGTCTPIVHFFLFPCILIHTHTQANTHNRYIHINTRHHFIPYLHEPALLIYALQLLLPCFIASSNLSNALLLVIQALLIQLGLLCVSA